MAGADSFRSSERGEGRRGGNVSECGARRFPPSRLSQSLLIAEHERLAAPRDTIASHQTRRMFRKLIFRSLYIWLRLACEAQICPLSLHKINEVEGTFAYFLLIEFESTATNSKHFALFSFRARFRRRERANSAAEYITKQHLQSFTQRISRFIEIYTISALNILSSIRTRSATLNYRFSAIAQQIRLRNKNTISIQ